MAKCFFCNSEGDRPLILKDTFTARSRARNPNSQVLCEACEWAINSQCWYWNPHKEAWSKLFARCWSWLQCGDSSRNLPTFHPSPEDKKDNLQEVRSLPTRANIREWLINPPEPPFVIVIAESGQKHIYPFRTQALNRDRFPILFEEDTVHIDRQLFTAVLETYEHLMILGFSKTEIDSGNYRSDRIAKCLQEWESLEAIYEPFRGALYGKLISYVAQKQEEQ